MGVNILIARLSRRALIIQEAMSYWDLRTVLEHVNPILLDKGYQPKYFFEGTPIMGQGGFSVIIKLDRDLGDLELRVLEKILHNLGLRVVRERRGCCSFKCWRLT